MTLLLLLAGCWQERAVSPRLVELDSLIAVAPDSAAALLQDYPADSLRDPVNRAYHALLTTQAKYKAYIPATSDSAINIAVDHYVTKNRGDYDRRIRSLIYKGCVMTELGQPDSAMYWFKAAETAARPDDHANLGYICYRIGEICMNEHRFDNTTKCYLTTALEHFAHTQDTTFELSCLLRVGSILMLTDKDNAQAYFQKAVRMSEEAGDTLYVIESLHHQIWQEIENQNYALANNLTLQSISLNDTTLTPYACASISFSGLSQPDSALKYLSLMPRPRSRADSMTFHRAHAEFARAQNDMDAYVYHNDLAGRIADTIFLETQQAEIKEIEQKYENQVLAEKIKTSHTRLWLIAALLALFLTSTLLLAYKQINQRKERNLTESRLRQTIGHLSDMRQLIAKREQEIKLLRNQIEYETTSKEQLESRLQASGSKLNCLDDIIQGLQAIQRDRSKSKKREIAMSAVFWKNLEQCAKDGFQEMIENSKGLSDKEQKLLHLYCLNVPIELCAVMLDVSLKTVQNYRTNIARVISAQQTSNLDTAIDMFRVGHDE